MTPTTKSSTKKRKRPRTTENEEGNTTHTHKELKLDSSPKSRIGLISDTHGVLEDSVVDFLDASVFYQSVLHAGDVGDKRKARHTPHELLQKLSEKLQGTQVLACRGNVDDALPKKCSHTPILPQFVLHVDPTTSTRILVIHGDGVPDGTRIKNSNDGTLQVSQETWDMIQKHNAKIVVYGHSHLVGCQEVRGTLFINPGSAGPKRFKLPRSCGVLSLTQTYYHVEVHNVENGKILLSKSGLLQSNASQAGGGRDCI